MSSNRRNFLKVVAGGAALATISPKRAAAKAIDDPAEKGLAWHKAPCRFCGTGCGVLVGVKEGRAVAVRGDEACGVNKGLLCAKGYHLPGILYGADRLTKPLIRKNGKQVEASWEEAFDLMASKLKESLAKKGPKSVGMYGSGQWTVFDGYAAMKLFKGGIGTNNVDPNARLCMASAVVGFYSTFGMDEPMGCYDDLDLADTFVLWGNNMAEQHPVLFSRVIKRRRLGRDGVQIIELATRKTPTSKYCDSSWMFNPQSDLAIANAICHEIIKNGWVDKKFVEKHVFFKQGKTNIGWGLDDTVFAEAAKPVKFADYEKFLADYTPEKAAEISGVSAADIRKLAAQYGDPKRKVVSLWCMGVNQHTRGSWMNNLIYNMHLLTGKISKPGNGPFSLTGQPSACGTCREVGTLAHALPGGRVVKKAAHREFAEKVWGSKPGTIPAKPGYHAVAMFRALERGDLNWLWVQVTNPMVTMPNLNRFAKGPARDDTFIVVSDVYPTETTAIADVVLPSAMWVEREGVFGNSERRTQQFDKIVDGPGEVMDDARQIAELARRLGYGNLFPAEGEPFEKTMWEEYRKFTTDGKDLAPYDTYKQTRGGLRWPVVDGKETRWRYIEGQDPYVPKGAGFSFYGNKKQENRATIWLRPYEPPAEVPDAEYPLWLCTGRVLEHWHTGTMTRRVPNLHRAMPSAYVEIHPEDARGAGIANGQQVKLTTRRGELTLTAHVGDERTPMKGSIFVPFFDESKLVNKLTLDQYCPLSKEPDYKKCAVRIERA